MQLRGPSADDVPSVAAAISHLAAVGLRPLVPEREFPEHARKKLDELEGIRIPDPPLPLTWFHLALIGSEQLFANAIWHQDHCFDGAVEEDYAEIVASIMALAGEEWPSATVSATHVLKEGLYGRCECMEITVRGQGGCDPFELVADKDFDWAVVTRLNERLPAEATGRFAAFFDGNAIIVYLKPDQLKELSRLFGYDFISEIDPLDEQRAERWKRKLAPPSYPRTLVGQSVRGRAPIWVLIICLLMGIFASHELIAMISRGAPYVVSGRGDTLISYANDPLEFTFMVTVYVVGSLGFTIAPLCQIVMRLRALNRPHGDAP